MAKVEDFFLKTVNDLESAIDRVSFVIKKRFDLLEPISILPFLGFGNSSHVHLAGRVLEEEGISHPEEDDPFWTNLKNIWKRYETDEIPNVRIKATFQGQEKIITTDTEGYFNVTFDFKDPLPEDQLWHTIGLELLDNLVKDQPKVKAQAEIMVPPADAQFGVISDVDDTILVSHSTEMVKKAQLTFFNNARTRLPFKGVSAFYQALQKGKDGKKHNPIFYVSSSAWNLYDLLIHFCEVHDIPKGPVLLRDLGVTTDKFIKIGHIGHKMEKIEQVFNAYPDLPFILIGDSGQKDPEIYEKVVQNYSQKIVAIYIRDVSKDGRDQEVHNIASRLKEKGVEMILCEDTEVAARHAYEKGFIAEGTLKKIKNARNEDE